MDPNATPTKSIPTGWRSEVRCDVGRLRKVERTPSGGVRVPAAIARAGVLEYVHADGTRVLELVPEEEIADAEAQRSLRDAAVTVGHPGGGTRMVTPETHREDSVGHVSGEPRVDAEHLVAELAIQDADAIRRIDAGELGEISAGYSLFIDPTPGVWNGQRYDAVQRHRRYNHVALLPSGGGRAGASVALRLDGVAVPMQARAPQIPPARPAPITRTDTMSTERIDGIDYKTGSDEWAQAMRKRSKRLDEENAELSEKTEKADNDLEAMKAELDAAKAKAAELESQIAKLEDPEAMDARADARAKLLTTARSILGAEAKLARADGKPMSDREIKRAVLAKVAPDVDAKASDIYVDARFDAQVAVHAAAPSDPLVTARRDAFTAPAPTPAPTPGAPPGNAHTVGREPPRQLGR